MVVCNIPCAQGSFQKLFNSRCPSLNPQKPVSVGLEGARHQLMTKCSRWLQRVQSRLRATGLCMRLKHSSVRTALASEEKHDYKNYPTQTIAWIAALFVHHIHLPSSRSVLTSLPTFALLDHILHKNAQAKPTDRHQFHLWHTSCSLTSKSLVPLDFRNALMVAIMFWAHEYNTVPPVATAFW